MQLKTAAHDAVKFSILRLSNLEQLRTGMLKRLAASACLSITGSSCIAADISRLEAELVWHRAICKLDHQHLAAHLFAIIVHYGLLCQELVCICDETASSA